MAKQHEIEYAERMNAAHATHKPFSDPDCGRNLIRLGTIFTLLPPPPARVLDLGCGTGWTSQFFARAGYEVVGVDLAPEMIRLANEQRDAAGLTNLTFRVSDYEHLDFHEEFDGVIFFDALHHAQDEALAIHRAADALKPGGLLLAAEPGEGHAESEDARTAVARYGVTEKDMPPNRVVALGRAAGFTGFRVFPHPDALVEVVYHRRREPLADPFAEVDPALAKSAWRSLAGRVLRRAWQGLWRRPAPLAPWRLMDVEHLLIHIRTNGLVLMRKGAKGSTVGA